MSGRPIILFSDLDGTLLDEHSYSCAGADEALREIERRRIPLVFCTSKTRAEVEVLRRKLGNTHPFITENGGGIFIPRSYFPAAFLGDTLTSGYQCIALGRPYQEIVEQLEQIAGEVGTSVLGFHQMSAREIASNTGLSPEAAELARMREFDEPFFFVESDCAAEKAFAERARERGLQLSHGGRFWHLFSGSDKGRAVRKLTEIYQSEWGTLPRALAIGNSANDLPMLAAADLAVLLPGESGNLNSDVVNRLRGVWPGSAPGPKGWNQAVLKILQA